MKLRIESRLDLFEKIHFYQEGQFIASTFNKIYVNLNGDKQIVKLPTSQLQKLFGLSRYLRRLLRLDICHVLLTKDQLVIVREGIVYNYNLSSRVLTKTLKLKQCKNILHQSICSTPENKLYFGEYGNNPERESVNVYRSEDYGKSWEVVYSFPKGSIRHVHGCYYDIYTDKIWTLTGDYENENIIQFSNRDFTEIETIGDGSQKFRAVNVFFTKNEVHWIMDSPLEKCYQFIYNRKSKEVRKLDFFNGPIWYLKSLSDGLYLAGSSVEKGEGVLSNEACLYFSKDLKNWEIADIFQKDFLPMPYFKWGVMAFSNGEQSSKGFTIHFEGLKKVDGKSYLCSINQETDKSFSYKIFDSELHDTLNLPRSIEVTDLKIDYPLRDYLKFKLIRLNEILLLRYKLQQDKKNEGLWSERILRFLEVRMNKINDLLKFNYLDLKERESFKEHLISFLLESFYYSGDFRFLNTAIKLNQKVKGIHANHRIYNAKLEEYLISKI